MKKVLFVCIENSCSSQIAEAFTHFYGRDKIEDWGIADSKELPMDECRKTRALIEDKVRELIANV